MPSNTPQPYCREGVRTWTVAWSQSTYSPSIQILRVASIGISNLLVRSGGSASLLLPPGSRAAAGRRCLRAHLARYGDGDLVPDLLSGVSRSTGQDRYDGLLQRGRRLLLSQVVEHQPGREHRGDGVGPAGPGDVGGGAVHRLEQRRARPAGATGACGARVEVGARRRAEPAGDRGAEVGQDVAEQVVGDDHVEAPWVVDQVQAGGVDVAVVQAHAGL